MSSPAHSEKEDFPDIWKTVCLADDLVPGAGIKVLFEHREVALFLASKSPKVYALSNYDPFSRANVLCRGRIGSLQGEIVVASPIFNQHFCLKTGRCLEDGNLMLETWKARIDGSHVQLMARI